MGPGYPHLAFPWEGEERHGDWRCILVHPPAPLLPLRGGGRVGVAAGAAA
jgi:hypothetical protein